MKALFGIGSLAVLFAVCALEGGAFNCLQAFMVGGIGAMVSVYGFNRSGMRE